MNIDKVTGRRKTRHQVEIVRHTRKCCICNHPRREELEEDYLDWRKPREIVEEYQLAHHSAIYRHAQALGLTARRVENAYAALDLIVEKVEDAPITGHTIIRAMRAYSCLTPKGRWIDPPKRIIHEVRHPAPAAVASSASATVVAGNAQRKKPHGKDSH